KLNGRDAVVQRMIAADTGRVYREATWAEPVRDGAAWKVTGKMPAGSPMGGAVLMFHLSDDKISLVQHQPIPGTPMPATAMKMSPELKKLVNNALATRHPMLVAYVDETGQPVLSFRGSTQAFSDDQLSIWVRNSDGNFLNSVAKHPNLAFMYRDEDTK